LAGRAARTETLATLMDRVAARLPRELVPPERLLRLNRAARRLPPCYLAGLECRLVGQGQPVDIWVCPALEQVALRRAGAWLQRQPWLALQPLAGELVRTGPPWPTGHGAWTLEFDLANPEPLPLPSSFVTFGAAEGRAGAWTTLQRLWTGSRGQPPGVRDRKAIESLLERCPEGNLAGLGFLYPRPGSPARLMLAVPQAEALAGWLENRWTEVQALFGGLTDQLVAAASIHPGAEATISIEAYLWRPEAWTELADRLVGRGLCLPERAPALTRLARIRGIEDGAWCSLNHVKLALGRDGSAAVKAYPAFGLENPGEFPDR